MSIAAAFDRARDYDAHAGVQRAVADALAERILRLPLPERPRVLEIGCGTGFLGQALIDRLPGARWLMTDIAPGMIARARARFGNRADYAVMDGEAPSVSGPFDLICSSLAAQWFADLPAALGRLTRLLAPGGYLALATLAGESFAEWRAAHPEGCEPGLRRHPAIAALRVLGAEVEEERRRVPHADARAFLRSLKAIGAGTPRPGHRPLGPAALKQTMRRFEAEGAIATYHIAYLTIARPL
ncbi:MAG TPA: methyltransferase domain-containing protein [Sphingomonas sp.]|nr:methyltransferase domain-containing protein [Sphingomonas sp.]